MPASHALGFIKKNTLDLIVTHIQCIYMHIDIILYAPSVRLNGKENDGTNASYL